MHICTKTHACHVSRLSCGWPLCALGLPALEVPGILIVFSHCEYKMGLPILTLLFGVYLASRDLNSSLQALTVSALHTESSLKGDEASIPLHRNDRKKTAEVEPEQTETFRED